MADDLNKALTEGFDELNRRLNTVDERFGELADQLAQTNGLLESFATATAQRFDQVDQRFDGVERRFDSLTEQLTSEATNVDLVQQDVRRLRETIEDNVVPRLSNLEAQIN